MKTSSLLSLVALLACRPALKVSPTTPQDVRKQPENPVLEPDTRDNVTLIVVVDSKSRELVRGTERKAAAYLRQCVRGEAADVDIVELDSKDAATKFATETKKASVMFEVRPVGAGISLKVSALGRNGTFKAVGDTGSSSPESIAIANALEEGSESACRAWGGGLVNIRLQLTCAHTKCDEVIDADSRFETKGAETIRELPWSSRFPVERRTQPYEWRVYLKDGRRLRASVFTDKERLECSKSVPDSKAIPGFDGWIDVGRCP